VTQQGFKLADGASGPIQGTIHPGLVPESGHLPHVRGAGMGRMLEKNVAILRFLRLPEIKLQKGVDRIVGWA
jgi:hypothetical protein